MVDLGCDSGALFATDASNFLSSSYLKDLLGVVVGKLILGAHHSDCVVSLVSRRSASFLFVLNCH